MTANDAVLTEVRGRVLLITLNRPDQMNAVNAQLAAGVLAAIERLDGDDALSAGVMTGAGRGFCAGMDLKAFAEVGPPVGFTDFLQRGSRKPLIAAVESFALAGGLEVALTCDLIVAGEGSRFGIPEVNVGLFAGGGAVLRLPGRVPFSVAMEMALTGDPITAEQAQQYGLVARVAPKGESVRVAMELAERISRNAPLAVVASKHILRETPGRTEAELWAYQRPLLDEVFTSQDALEGARAFAEKRPPNWSGR